MCDEENPHGLCRLVCASLIAPVATAWIAAILLKCKAYCNNVCNTAQYIVCEWHHDQALDSTH